MSHPVSLLAEQNLSAQHSTTNMFFMITSLVFHQVEKHKAASLRRILS